MCAVAFELLTTVEAAERIGVERSNLTRWVQLGRMKVAHKLPGKNGAMFFDPEEVDRVAAEYAAGRFGSETEAEPDRATA